MGSATPIKKPPNQQKKSFQVPQKAKYTESKQFPPTSLSQTKHYIFTTMKKAKKKHNRNLKK